MQNDGCERSRLGTAVHREGASAGAPSSCRLRCACRRSVRRPAVILPAPLRLQKEPPAERRHPAGSSGFSVSSAFPVVVACSPPARAAPEPAGRRRSVRKESPVERRHLAGSAAPSERASGGAPSSCRLRSAFCAFSVSSDFPVVVAGSPPARTAPEPAGRRRSMRKESPPASCRLRSAAARSRRRRRSRGRAPRRRSCRPPGRCGSPRRGRARRWGRNARRPRRR